MKLRHAAVLGTLIIATLAIAYDMRQVTDTPLYSPPCIIAVLIVTACSALLEALN